jgi:hypothetical protein
MPASVLIGNGINARSDKPELFSNIAINSRFLELFDDFTRKDIRDLEFQDAIIYAKNNVVFDIRQLNIEHLTNRIYISFNNLFSNKYKDSWDTNDFILKNLLRKIALNAIFYQKNKLINLSIDNTVISALSRYDNIYTLNYHEYWDYSQKVHYLHGKAILTDCCVQNPYDCYFSPLIDIAKSKAFVQYPSETSFPSEDIFPTDDAPLYTDLDNISEIEVFGVSPYGDKELVEKLKNISNIIIYIYKIAENVEKDEWKRKIPHAVFLDSEEFIA